MTSNVKSWLPIVLHFLYPHGTASISRAGARKRRQLIVLLSVGWLPPSVRPSGAGLALGTRSLDKPLNAAEGDTTPGLRFC
jgi:hypothetical protein